MDKLGHQTTEYLEGLDTRIVQENADFWQWAETRKKIKYILECREQWKEPKMCMEVCDSSSCWPDCINQQK